MTTAFPIVAALLLAISAVAEEYGRGPGGGFAPAPAALDAELPA